MGVGRTYDFLHLDRGLTGWKFRRFFPALTLSASRNQSVDGVQRVLAKQSTRKRPSLKTYVLDAEPKGCCSPLFLPVDVSPWRTWLVLLPFLSPPF